MKHNIAEVAKLQPDYLGFIFYDKSPRFFDGEIPSLPTGIKKVGVFVDASLEEILEKVKKYSLDVVQLHGEENVSFCKTLKKGLDCARPDIHSNIEIWKVFSIKDKFNFDILEPYENAVDKFLFDTKGKEKGGNGYTFDWKILKNYPSKKPFILSGGIGLEEIEAIKKLMETNLPIHAIDVNSKFENEPGKKDVSALRSFIEILKHD